jgi:hypothetical protein
MVPYVYPKLEFTQPVKLSERAREVHAFRVDCSRLHVDVGEIVTECLSEKPISSVNEAPPQIKPSVTYGFAVLGFALNYLVQKDHTVAVRLYRPGYALVEVKPREHVDQINWTPATDLASQEEALDRLLPPKDENSRKYSSYPSSRQLRSGSTSSAHRTALLFGASEYDRLAESASQSDKVRLKAKASELRRLASE